MEWVVGAGRCGLHNYTALNGGWIQSRKDWKGVALKKYFNEIYSADIVRNVIEYRKTLPYSCITDCAQFIFIDDIRRYDDIATFTWVRRRNRENHIKSFMQRVGEDSRIHPKGWKFETSRKRELIEWYLDEVERIIKSKLEGVKYREIWTEDMARAGEAEIEALRRFA